MVEHLPSKHKALSSNSSTAKKSNIYVKIWMQESSRKLEQIMAYYQSQLIAHAIKVYDSMLRTVLAEKKPMRKCICQTKKKVLRKNVNISKSTFMSQV
jgi:hypothetical protein